MSITQTDIVDVRPVANWLTSVEEQAICKFSACAFKTHQDTIFVINSTTLKIKLHFIKICALFLNVNKMSVKKQ